MNMKRKVSKSLNIIFIILFILGTTLNSYAATTQQSNTEEYEIAISKEKEFLDNIYNKETENLKVKEISKEISDNNYTEKDVFKTKTLTKNNTEYIYNEFGETQKFDDGEYQGTLNITDIDIETIKNGYYEKIDEKVLNFNNYTDNDLNNIEKEIILNNQTYYLINVEWEAETTENIDGAEVPLTYKGNKKYQTIQKIANPNTYKVTVKYSGRVEKIDTLYNYKIIYENIEKEENVEKEENNIVPIIVVSGIGLTILLIALYNMKNTYIYSKIDKGFKLIKREKLSDKKVSIDITKCKNKSVNNIYAIKVNSIIFKKLKGRTISIVLGNKKKDIVLWNDYYEIKL
ncbi:MAG: hypothetical protein J6J60_00755 [Clostridia bacterium]|nr:hypothetical protein [Clostridia bacterium]